MKGLLVKISWLALSLLLACAPVAARRQQQSVSVELVDEHVGIDFVPPPGVTPATEKELEAVRAAGFPVKFLFRDAGWALTITAGTSGEGLSADAGGMANIQKGFEEGVEKRDPGGEWLTREFVVINGQKWLRMRRKSAPAEDAEVNDYYLTVWGGRLVLFNFSSPVAGYETRRAAMEKSARTIQLSLIVAAPVEVPAPQRTTPARRPARRARRP